MMAWLLFLSVVAQASTFTEDFSTSDRFEPDGSTAVWNLESRRVQVPFVIDRDEDGDEDESLDIGSGKDGPFSADTFTLFDANATDNLVTLDSSRVYEFTSFTLPVGVTLTATGTSPLRIHVQGSATIAGTIDLSGSNGADGSSTTTAASGGGSAICGGGAGGDGGNTNAAASDGQSLDSNNATQGIAGTAGSAGGGSGGGGGGGMEATFNPAANGSNGAGGGAGTGGAAGASTSDVFLSDLIGGGGGGGGEAYLDNPIGSRSTGGAGGGGGGALKLFAGGAIEVKSTGIIRADGGDGGAVGGGRLGGGGGGGGGGMLLLASASTLTNSGTLSALPGSGGTAAGGGNGGTGGYGRTRLVDNTSGGWKFNDPAGSEDPTPNMAEFGRTYSTLNEVVVLSKPIDTFNSAPEYQSATLNSTLGSGDTAVLEVAGSNVAFEEDVAGSTGFVAASEISQLDGLRYFRFRIRLQAGARTNLPLVSSVSIEYTERVENQFRFRTVSCARVHRGEAGGEWGFGLLALYLTLLPLLTRKVKIPTEARRPFRM